MAQRSDVDVYLSALLQSASFKDYGPNGLQIEGRAQVRRLVSGVTASLALIEAAAAMLGVDAASCTALAGVVSGGGKSVTYGQIVAKGLSRSFTADELSAMPIKPAAERRLIGRPVTALDVAGKIDGSAVYGIDAKVDGMVFARPLLPPTRNGSVATAVDDTAAKGVKGYLSSLILNDPSGTVPGWVMVVALPVVVQALSVAQIALLFAGGVFYTVGAILFGLERPTLKPHVFGFHELWHVMTVAAAACHYVLVLSLVSG